MKKTKLLTSFGISILMATLFSGVTSAQTVATSEANRFSSSGIEESKEKIKKGTILMKKIESSLKGQESDLTDLRSHIKKLKLKIQENREEVKSLKGQLFNLQTLLAQSQRKLLAIRKQIAERENELLILRDTLETKRGEKEKAFTRFANLSNLASLRRAEILEKDGFGILSFFIANGGLSEQLQGNLLFEIAEDESKERLRELDRAERELFATQKKVIEKHEIFRQLQAKQQAEIRNIQYHQEAGKRLLSLTKGEEKIYQTLLEEARKEQESVSQVIENLKSNQKFVEEKLRVLKEDEFLQSEIAVDDFEDALRQIPLKTRSLLRWPVSPLRGISAHFHDEAYRKSMGIPHNAIDIRIPQGTKVKAALRGVVLKVRDSDIGYNYVILAHRDSYLTLYGHLTEISVKEGETVFSGEAIGVSGGIPGTRGAGWLTTGAHLHLELFKDWKHVDPLDYLPLEFLPIDYVPEKYLPKLIGEEEKVRRVQEQKVRRVLE